MYRKCTSHLGFSLAYRKSVALADISTAVDNVFVQTPKGYVLSNNSVMVYDNVYGGLGLTEALWWHLEEYAQQLLRGASRERKGWNTRYLSPDNAHRLSEWLDQENDEPGATLDDSGTEDWWRIIRPGSQVSLYQQDRDGVGEGTLVKPMWQDGVRYVVETPGGGRVTATDEQLTPPEAKFDWQVWQPSTGQEQELHTERDF